MLEIILSPIRGQTVSASTLTARVSNKFQKDEIRVYSTSDFYIKFGGDTVTCTTTVGGYDAFYPAGSHDLNTRGLTHAAFILGSGTATIHVHEYTKND
jgi:hypothetical protein